METLGEGIAEKEAAAWFSNRRRIREFSLKLKREQEALRAREQRFPWLGSFKGVLRKKDGKNFDIPEGLKATKEAPPEPEAVPGPSTETLPPKREEKKLPEKRKSGPLLAKAKREAELKRRRTRTPPTADDSSTPKRGRTLQDLSQVPLSVLREALAARGEDERRSSWASSIGAIEEEGGSNLSSKTEL